MKNSNLNEQLNIKNYLTTLQNLPHIEDYKQLGQNLNAICNVLKTALFTEIHQPEFTEHSKYDLFCLIDLVQKFIPNEELELLDNLNDL